MTAHFMQGIVESSFDKVFKALSKTFGNVYSKQFGDTEQSQIGIILGEQYSAVTNSDVAVSVILKEFSSDETEIEVFSYAGGVGLLSISYSVHSHYVHDVKDFLVKCGLKIKAEKETPSIKFRYYPK